jgi:hypothetical protein
MLHIDSSVISRSPAISITALLLTCTADGTITIFLAHVFLNLALSGDTNTVACEPLFPLYVQVCAALSAEEVDLNEGAHFVGKWWVW